MGDHNSVTLIGRLGKDPDVRYSKAGTAVANFSMATSNKWKDKSGMPREETWWHRVVAWEKQAEHVGQYLHKGDLVHVEGELVYREWTDKDGVKKISAEVKARRVNFLSTRGGANSSNSAPADAPSGAPADEDIPF